MCSFLVVTGHNKGQKKASVPNDVSALGLVTIMGLLVGDWEACTARRIPGTTHPFKQTCSIELTLGLREEYLQSQPAPPPLVEYSHILNLYITFNIFMIKKRILIYGSILNRNSTPKGCYPSSASSPCSSSMPSSTATFYYGLLSGLINGNYVSDAIEQRVNKVLTEEWGKLDTNLDH